MNAKPSSADSDATQRLIDTLRKHTGQSEEETRETIARALDRALETTDTAPAGGDA